MSSSRYRYFRWTRRTALITFNYMIVVPVIIGTAAYATEVRPGRQASFSPMLWKRKADLIGDDYRASGTSGRRGKETWLLNTRGMALFCKDAEFAPGMQLQGDKYKNESSTNITISDGALAHLRSAYRNSMPSGKN